MTRAPQRTVTLRIRAPLERSEVPGLVARTCALLEGQRIAVIECSAAGVSADAAALEALARLALAAKRRGCALRLTEASDELLQLVRIVGLAEVFGLRG